MEMGHDVRAFCSQRDDCLGQQVGLYGGDAQPLQTLQSGKSGQQINQPLPLRPLVLPYVHTGEHNLLDAVRHHVRSVGQQPGGISAAEPAPGKRHSAIGAEIIAAVLHFQKGARAFLLQGVCAEKTGRLLRTAVEHVGVVLKQQGQFVRKLEFGVAPQHHIRTELLLQRPGFQGGIAAHQHHFRLRIALADTVHIIAALASGLLRHGTGVQHIDIRLPVKGHAKVARLRQAAFQSGGFTEIQLTAQGFESHTYAHSSVSERSFSLLRFSCFR